MKIKITKKFSKTAFTSTFVLASLVLGASPNSNVLAATIVNTDVSTSSYLSNSAGQELTATEIQPDNGILIGGNFANLPATTASYSYLSGTSGAILKLNSDGRTTKALARLGTKVSDLDINRSDGRVYAVGNFGLAALSLDLNNLLWSKTGGNFGAISNAEYSDGRRVAVSSDGTVAASFNNQVFVFDSNGNQIGTPITPFANVTAGAYNHRLEDIALYSTKKWVVVAGFAQQCTNYQSPYLLAYSYDPATFGQLVYRSYNWFCSGVTAANLGADSRLKRVVLGRDNKLYIVGTTDGGNNVFTRNARYLSATATRENFVQTSITNVNIDNFTNGAGSGAGKYGYYARIDNNLEVERGQFIYSSLGVNQARSFSIDNIYADTAGNVTIVGNSNKDMPNRANLSINSSAIGARVDNENSLQSYNSTFGTRLRVASWTAPSGMASSLTNIASFNGITVVGGKTDGPIVTANALVNTKSAGTVGFFSVIGNPTNPSDPNLPTNNSPTISITNPANNATVNKGVAVNITSTASDSDGTVSSVSYYLNGALLGTVTGSNPFNYSWTPINIGSYTLTARATDNGGATKDTSITVNVVDPTWSNWERIGSATVLGLDQLDYNNNLTQAVRGTDNRLYTRFFNTTNSTWSNWVEGGGITIKSKPTLYKQGNVMYVTAAGTDNKMYTRSFNLNTNTWSNWIEGNGITIQQAPEMIEYNSKLYQMVVGTDNGLYSRTLEGNIWSAWQRMGAITLTETPSLRVYNSRLYITARGTDSKLYHRNLNGTTWSNYSEGNGIILKSKPESEVYNNQLYQSAEGIDNRLYTRSFNGTTWSNWTEGNGITTNGVPTIQTFGNKLYQFSRGTDQRLYARTLTTNTWSAWELLETINSLYTPEATPLTATNQMYLGVIGTDFGLYTKRTPK